MAHPIRSVHDGDKTVRVGADDNLGEQIEMVYRFATEAMQRVHELEEDVDELREALIHLGGPSYRERLTPRRG